LFTNKLVSGSDYDTAVANLHEAEATVQIKQASLDNANANLGYCKIRSPVDGIVILRAIDLGQTVASSFNTPTLFQIANDLTKMQIDSSVAEADVGGVVEGQERAFHGGRVSRADVLRHGHAGAQFADDRQQRRHLRLRHQRDERGLQIETRHDGECFHHRRPTRKCVDHSEWCAAIPSAGKSAVVLTNIVATQTAPATNSGNFAGTSGVQGHRSGHARGERPVFHTIYVLSGTGDDAKLQAVQIKTGISDGISTEVLSGLDEGAQVVTGVVSTGTQAAKTSNPFGGFPRMR
jgi:HlyD family secretion protein